MLMMFRSKLIALTSLAAVAGAVVGLVGYRSITSLAQTQSGILLVGNALRNQADADMMHDALRGDVLSALASQSEDELTAAGTDLGEHSKMFRESMAANDALPLSEDIKAAIADIRPSLNAYIDAAGEILERGEGSLAHDALQHHAPGDPDFDRHALQFFGCLVAVAFEQLERRILALEVVGEGFARLAPFGELGAALGDELILVLLDRGGLFGVGHEESSENGGLLRSTA
jgi:hypothetical protein